MVIDGYCILGFVGLEFQNIGDWVLFSFSFFCLQFTNGGVSIGGFNLIMVYFGLSKMKISVFFFLFFFYWKNMSKVDKIVNNVDVKKMELKNKCERKKIVFGEEKKWLLIEKSEWGWRRKEMAVWSINGSCASHMITNGKNGWETWQKGQSTCLIKGRESWCMVLKYMG